MQNFKNLNDIKFIFIAFIFIILLALQYGLVQVFGKTIYIKLYSVTFSLVIFFILHKKSREELLDYMAKDSEDRKLKPYSNEVDLRRVLMLILRIFLYSGLTYWSFRNSFELIL